MHAFPSDSEKIQVTPRNCEQSDEAQPILAALEQLDQNLDNGLFVQGELRARVARVHESNQRMHGALDVSETRKCAHALVDD